MGILIAGLVNTILDIVNLNKFRLLLDYYLNFRGLKSDKF